MTAADDELQAATDYIVQKSGTPSKGSTNRVLHLPADESDPAAGEAVPACGRSHTKVTWEAKPASIYPLGYRSFCQVCRAIGTERFGTTPAAPDTPSPSSE